MSYDVEVVRKDFPILSRILPNGKPLVYLDSSNTSQKPQQVIDAEREFYEQHNANVARAIHTLGAEATEAYEARPFHRRRVPRRGRRARDRVREELDRGASTCVARVLGDAGRVGPGDEVLITEMEHHSNIVPWQLLCERTGATLRWIGLDRRRPARPRRPRHAAQRADRDRVVRPHVQHPRHDQPGRDRRTPGEAGRGAGDARRVAVGAAPRRRRAGTRHRPARLHRAQDGRPDRDRRALGPLRPARGAAAVPRRRRDDRGGRHDRLDLRAAARPVRGRYAADRAGRRPRHRCRLPDRPRHGRDRRARAPAHGVPAGRLAARSTGCGSSARTRRSIAAGSCRSRSAGCIRTTSGRCSTSRGSRCGSVITAPDRSACATAYRRRRGLRCTCTPRRPTSMRWWPASNT